MPNRKQSHSSLYYIRLRAPAKGIFASLEEYSLLIRELSGVLVDTDYDLSAFCLLPGQAHLGVQIGRTSLQDFSQRLIMKFNGAMRLERQGPYKSFDPPAEPQLADNCDIIRRIVAGIHVLPLTIGVDPSEYAWSGHRTYLGKARMPCITLQRGLLPYGPTLKERLDGYQGDIERVLSINTACKNAPVGGSAARTGAAKSPLICTLDDLYRHALKVCGRTDDVRPNMFDWSSSRLLSVVAWNAIELHMATLKEVARYLQRSTSAINLAIKQNKDRFPTLFLKPGNLDGLGALFSEGVKRSPSTQGRSTAQPAI